jgi:molybdopterin-synthase adenylyltransferase
MDDRQLLRYSRHLNLPQIDFAGQEKLLAAHVVLIGAGGLGAPAALYLAAAGVGRLTICDGDAVDLTNLQRQIVHREASEGMNKAVSAARALTELNADCKVVAVERRVGLAEMMELCAGADVVVEGSDNFATRHAVNRACVANRVPLVSGAAIRYAGQLAVFDLRRADSPCYRCLFPDEGASDGERCVTMGVFAPLTGVIGVMQAGEAIRLITEGLSPVAGRMLLFDMRAMEWQSMEIPKNPQCVLCGDPSSGPSDHPPGQARGQALLPQGEKGLASKRT